MATHVCACLCVRLCVHGYTHMYAAVCGSASAWEHTPACTYVCIGTRMCVSAMHTRLCMGTDIRVPACPSVCDVPQVRGRLCAHTRVFVSACVYTAHGPSVCPVVSGCSSGRLFHVCVCVVLVSGRARRPRVCMGVCGWSLSGGGGCQQGRGVCVRVCVWGHIPAPTAPQDPPPLSSAGCGWGLRPPRSRLSAPTPPPTLPARGTQASGWSHLLTCCVPSPGDSGEPTRRDPHPWGGGGYEGDLCSACPPPSMGGALESLELGSGRGGHKRGRRMDEGALPQGPPHPWVPGVKQGTGTAQAGGLHPQSTHPRLGGTHDPDSPVGALPAPPGWQPPPWWLEHKGVPKALPGPPAAPLAAWPRCVLAAGHGMFCLPSWVLGGAEGHPCSSSD